MRTFRWDDQKLAELRIYRDAGRHASWIIKTMGITPRQLMHGVHFLEHPEEKEQGR